MDFYVSSPSPLGDIRQGDILENVPFSYFDPAKAKVIGTDRRSTVRDLSASPHGAVQVVATLESSWGIVLTQTCDLQPTKDGVYLDPILIARVRPIAEVVSDWDETTAKKRLSSVNALSTEAKAPNIFYLPPSSHRAIPLPSMGVVLLDAQRFDGANMSVLRRLIRLRLSEVAQHAFPSRIAYCFGRFTAPDDFFLSPDDIAEKQRRIAEKQRQTAVREL